MKYFEFRNHSCAVCNHLFEQDAVEFNRQNFYDNMANLKRQGLGSDLEGIDTLVRLGYLTKYSEEEIYNQFQLANPVRGARSYGTYNSETDQTRFNYNFIFDNQRITQTVAHELRHRAFSIISSTPELDNLMPAELKNRWGDGYGKYMDVYKWRYEGDNASPEHAMIYAVQYRDPMQTRSQYFTNPQLENKSIEYWRNLYREIESAVKSWFEKNVKSQPLQANSSGEMRPIFTIDPKRQSFYETMSKLNSITLNDLHFAVEKISLGAAFIMTSADAGKSEIDFSLQVLDALNDGLLADVPEPLEKLMSLTNDQKLAAAVNEFNRIGIPWHLLDARTFTQKEFDAIANLPKEPIRPVQVTTVQPQTTNLPKPNAPTQLPGQTSPDKTNTPTVVPVGNTIGLYQFSVQNQFAGQPIWNILQSQTSWQSLENWVNGVVLYEASKTGLKLDAENRAKLDAMFKLLKNKPYNRNEVAQFLARIELKK